MFRPNYKKIGKYGLLGFVTVCTDISYAGGRLFGMFKFLDYINEDSTAAKYSVGIIAVVLQTFIVCFSRSPYFWRMINGKQIVPQSTSSSRKEIVDGALVKVPTNIMKALGGLDGITSNILFTYLGTEAILDALELNRPKVLYPTVSVLIISDLLIYIAFNLMITLSNTRLTFRAMASALKSCNCHLSALLKTLAISTIWIGSEFGFAFFNMRNALDMIPYVSSLSDEVQDILGYAFALNFSINVFFSRVVDLHQRVFSNPEHQNEAAHTEEGYEELVRRPPPRISGKKKALVLGSAGIANCYLIMSSIVYYVSCIYLLEHLGAKRDKIWVQALSILSSLCMFLILRGFTHARTMDEIKTLLTKPSEEAEARDESDSSTNSGEGGDASVSSTTAPDAKEPPDEEELANHDDTFPLRTCIGSFFSHPLRNFCPNESSNESAAEDRNLIP